MARERFLVTGAAGFIGRHMVTRLLRDGHDVVCLDDFSTGSRDNLDDIRNNTNFITGSVTDADTVRQALQGVDRVIHLASVPSVPRSVEVPLESAHASIIGTVTLLDEAVKAGVKRVVQAASSSAYGDNPELPSVETAAPCPLSPYAAAKLTQEIYGAMFSTCYGLDTVALRYFNIFGPGQRPDSDYAAVIPKFIHIMRRGGQPEIYGDGLHTRDFTYIDNAVDANLLAATAPGTLAGAVMNIGTGNAYSLNDLVRELNGVLGTDIQPRYAPPRAGDIKDSLANIAKAEKLIGYKPTVGFVEGLRRTAESFPA
ncbi:MAG: NAD-dependent epimerase/dehydratase family protein [Planctomycetes bacterium]|nr:NAD-dependent epimerase/dehydratase family protein [Planctomycetota bacterium]